MIDFIETRSIVAKSRNPIFSTDAHPNNSVIWESVIISIPLLGPSVCVCQGGTSRAYQPALPNAIENELYS